MFDVRCTCRQPGTSSADDTTRCQLLAGHEGPHAVMLCRSGHRVVRTWVDHAADSLRDHDAGQELLPWVRGLPQPAWTEPG